jgi:hypothetical protein
VPAARSAMVAGYLRAVDYLKVVASADSCDGGRSSILALGLSAVLAASADPAVLTASFRQDAGYVGLVVLSARVEFDRWAASLDPANLARVTCPARRRKRSPSLLPRGFPRPVRKP